MDPVLVQLGPFAIRWYALAYIARAAVRLVGGGTRHAQQIAVADPPFNGRPPATEEQIGDLVVWGTFGVILGGRLGWDLIYGVGLCSVSPDAEFCRGLPYAFVTNPLKLIAAWEGGMSFHGGLMGVVIAVWLFCRRHKLAFLSVADLVCAFAPMGLFLGRLANFVNGELWGRVTDVPWAMVFPRGGPLPRHPSQLYEAALEGILLFIIVQVALRVFRAQNRPGLISASSSWAMAPSASSASSSASLTRRSWVPSAWAWRCPFPCGWGRRSCWPSPSNPSMTQPEMAAPKMATLNERIAALIAAQGPISVAQYMALALHDPEGGYYSTRDPFGRAGDFITAPEISQMFGEILGLWWARCGWTRTVPRTRIWWSWDRGAAP